MFRCYSKPRLIIVPPALRGSPMKSLPFSELNRIILDKLTRTGCYMRDGYSFLKVFQHALVFSAEERANKVQPSCWSWPFLFLLMREYLRAFRGRRMKRVGFREILLIDPGRAFRDEAGREQSVHFFKIRRLLGERQTTLVSLYPGGKGYADYQLSEFTGCLPPPSRADRKMLRTLRRTFLESRRSGVFSEQELRYIASALDVFYSGYRLWGYQLRRSAVSQCYLVCHYHIEYLIAVLGEMGVQVVEIQHGLISPRDIYYVYDKEFGPALRNAFFPDYITVYGPYWKRILLKGSEFSPGQIIVAGNYRPWKLHTPVPFHQRKPIILVCSQKEMETAYVPIVDWISAAVAGDPNWSVVLKLHPQEQKRHIYESRSWPKVRIAGPHERIDDLLDEVSVQLTIYSTTLYDALGRNVVNFSVQDAQSADYASDMVQEKVAFPIRIGEDILARYREAVAQMEHLLSSEEVYSPFRSAVFQPDRLHPEEGG